MMPTNDAAKMISEFLDELRHAGIGPDLAQKVIIAATPVIVAVALTEGTGAIA